MNSPNAQTGSNGTPFEHSGWLTRERALVFILAAVTVLLVYLCYRMALTFLPALTWALALALVARPLHSFVAHRIKNQNLAATATVFLVAVLIIGPGLWMVSQLLREVAANMQWVQDQAGDEKWRERLSTVPYLGEGVEWLEARVDLKTEAERMVRSATPDLAPLIAGSIEAAFQLIIMLFILFFCFRDRDKALAVAKSLVPLSRAEVDHVFARVGDTIHATIYGSVTVALIQGFLGGLIFWWLGLPAPVFWGLIMSLLAVVPNLGAFVIWLPTSLLLFLQGDWKSGLFLLLWGSLVISLIDNLLYPLLVGGRLRLHTLPTFIAIVGGFSIFGASGLILGPVTLAVTLALLDVWRHRTAEGRSAEEGVNGLVQEPANRVENSPNGSVLAGAAEN